MTPEQQLEHFKAHLQTEVERQKAAFQLELQRAKAETDAHYEHWRLTIQRETQAQAAMFSGVVAFALAALRSIILVNGGSAIAVLAFLGNVWNVDDQAAHLAAAATRPAMVAFVLGTLCGCASTAAS